MENKNPIFEQLKVLRDEIKVQAHLFSMDSKENLQRLEKRFSGIESKAEGFIKDFGKLNESFWVGNDEEVSELKKEYSKLKESLVTSR